MSAFNTAYPGSGDGTLLAIVGGTPRAVTSSDSVTLGLASLVLNGGAAEANALRLQAGGNDFIHINGSTGALTLGKSDGSLTFASTGNVGFNTTGTLTLGGVGSTVAVTNDLTVAGNLTINGTTTTVNSTTLTIDDNTIVVNSGPTSTKDGGLLIQRWQSEVDDSTGDVVNDTAVESGTAQAGALMSITLAADASAVDDAYNNWYIKITGGTGSGQVRKITDYNGTTKVASVSGWSVTPDATSTYSLYNRVFIALFYDESADELVVGAAVADSSTALVSQDQIKVHMGALTADDAVSFGSTLTVTGAGEFDSTLGADGNFRVGSAGASNFTVAAASGNTAVAGTLDVTGNSTLASVDVGGGYGSTGVTISAAGAIQANGALTVDGASTLTGAVTMTGGFDANAASTVSTLTVDGADGSRYVVLSSNTNTVDVANALFVHGGELYYRETTSGGTNLVAQITNNGAVYSGAINSTDSLGFTINADGAAGVEEDGYLDIVSSDATSKYVGRTRVITTNATAGLEFYLTDDGTEMNTIFAVGQFGSTTSRTGSIFLSSGDGVTARFFQTSIDTAGAVNFDGTNLASFTFSSGTPMYLYGDTTIGADNTKTLTISALLASSLVPNADSSHSLGSNAAAFANVYADTLTTVAGGALAITAEGITVNSGGSAVTFSTVADFDAGITLATAQSITGNGDMTVGVSSGAFNLSLKMGDNAGGQKVSFKDSDSIEVAYVNSDGLGYFTTGQTSGAMTVGGTLAVTGASTFTAAADFDGGITLAANQSVTGDGALTMGVSAGAYDLSLKMGDDAGTQKVSFKDSGSIEVAYVNSDGLASFTDVRTPALSASAGSLAIAATAGSISITPNSDLILDAAEDIITENDIVAGGAIAEGDLLAVNSAGKLVKADANDHAHLAGTASAAYNLDEAVGLCGMLGSLQKVSTDISALAAGSVVYLSETAGAVTGTAPTTSGAHVIRAGIVVTPGAGAGSGYILFQPQYMYQA